MKFVMSYGKSLDGGPPGVIIYIHLYFARLTNVWRYFENALIP